MRVLARSARVAVAVAAAAALVVAAAVLAPACTRDTGASARPTPAPEPRPAPAPGPRRIPRPPIATDTNIARADYIGPDRCGECHAEQHAAWSQSLHRVMNARPDTPGAVIGDFASTTIPYAGGTATFTHDAAGYSMTLRKANRTVHYRVTRTIGHRALQEYVGVEDGHTEEVRLPFGWWPRAGGWYPQPYFDPWLGDERNLDVYAPVREPWAERCPWCHSTYPFEQRIARSSGPHGLGHGLEQLYESSPGGERLAVDEQVTTGISCESCHLGGRVHADGGPIHFVPQGATARSSAPKLPATFADERRDAEVVNHVCAQCHSGPSPRLPDGTALRNSSEALDLAASPCHGIRCTDCHDPHRADARADEARAIKACIGCHASAADPAHAGAAHAAHPAAGHAATATCLDCHMPRIVMGIDRFVRTHRISSPSDPALFGSAAPNACNVCHLDRSFAWTADALRDGWDIKLRRPTGREAEISAGEQWLASATPAYRILATYSYAHSPFAASMRHDLERGLHDPLAYVRAWTKLSLGVTTDVRTP